MNDLQRAAVDPLAFARVPRPGEIFGIVRWRPPVDPVLNREAELVTYFGDDLAGLAADLFATMYAAGGVGIAAPQIGVNRRVAVINLSRTLRDRGDGEIVLVNPAIVERSAETLPGEEGCLSLPGFGGRIARARWVKVLYHDLRGREQTIEGEGLLARALQHEIDHLNGILFTRHMSLLKRDLIRRRIKKAQRRHAR